MLNLTLTVTMLILFVLHFCLLSQTENVAATFQMLPLWCVVGEGMMLTLSGHL